MIALGTSAVVERDITAADVAAFAVLSLDDNPLHTDEAFAAGSIYGRCIAHGMLGLALVSGVLTKLCGHGNIWLSSQFNFCNPVFVGDHLRCSAILTAYDRRDVGEVTFLVSRGDVVVLTGSARCFLPAGNR